MIPITRPWLDEREAAAARRPIERGWVMQGPEVEAFEREFAARVGARHACALSSGTAGLHLVLRALGIGPGDEVVTVSHTFVAVPNSVRLCGAVPVFVDVERGTYNLDPALVARALTPRTKAILAVHQLGMPCDLAALGAIARERGLRLVEDAACAAGSEILSDGIWKPIGRPHGDAAIFSFHPRKVITTGDGGMVTTSDPELDARIRRARQHGAAGAGEAFVELGLNYRLTDLQAAVGRVQLERLPEIVARRRALADGYRRLLGDLEAVALPVEPPFARSNWQSYCVRLAPHLNPRAVAQRMEQAGVATRPGLTCAHREPVYAKEPWSCGIGPGACGCAPGRCTRLEESEAAQRECLLLPLFPQMTAAEQEQAASALRAACAC